MDGRLHLDCRAASCEETLGGFNLNWLMAFVGPRVSSRGAGGAAGPESELRWGH
jgi:hypothetical protein